MSEGGPGERAQGSRGARKSLSHVGGAARFEGDEALREVMVRASTPPALAAPDASGGAIVDRPELALTHGFHPWPGRLHPHTARTLIAAAGPGCIADPFMGAGTVPLEAMRAGRLAWGNDLNPIGCEVAWVRTRRFSDGALRALVARAKLVDKKAQALARGAIGTTGSNGAIDPSFVDKVGRWFDAQALAEVWALATCLREGDPAWQGSPGDPLTRVLAMVLSSILVKASRQVSDSVAKLDRRELAPTPPGRVGHWFRKRTEELAGQLAGLAAEVARDVPEPLFTCGDARTVEAPGALRPPSGASIAAVISSPPYPGVYDYLTHHALRCHVLGLPLGEATEREIGSRRASERLGREAAHARYVDDLAAVLARAKERLAADGFVAFVIGDGQVGTSVVPVLPLLARAAASAGLAVRATLSQARPTFGAPSKADPGARSAKARVKEEHLVWLDPAPPVAAAAPGRAKT